MSDGTQEQRRRVSIPESALQALMKLEQLPAELPERELIQHGIDLAQDATSSRIGYLHYLNDDQDTIELGVWSSGTRDYCTAIYDRHYPISMAGIWADSARERRHCMHNNYPATPNRRGLPEGHSVLTRHLGVPVIDQGRVRLLVGVGNKDTDYDEDDLAALTLVSERIWSLVRQRRLLERHLDLELRLRHIQEMAAVCGFEFDVDEDRLHFDDKFAGMFRLRRAAALPQTLQQFLGSVDPADHDSVRSALTPAGVLGRRLLRLRCRRGEDETFPAELKIDYRPREVGQGLIGVGILQDTSERVVMQDLRRRADADALTALPNRNRLQALFDQDAARRRRADEHIAFHYIDLDDFKPVNDTYGHPVGDEVLRIVASRLRHTVRKADLVVRMGGDEFGVVQMGLAEVRAACVLADKIVASIAQPIVVAGRTVHIGASIGIAVRRAADGRLDDLSAAADRALYQAKAAGGRCWVLAPDGAPPAA